MRTLGKFVPPVYVGDSTEVFLTEFQSYVLECLCRGMPSQEIRNQLYISNNTLKTHIKDIFVAMGVHSRLEAATSVFLGKIKVTITDKTEELK